MLGFIAAIVFPTEKKKASSFLEQRHNPYTVEHHPENHSKTRQVEP